MGTWPIFSWECIECTVFYSILFVVLTSLTCELLESLLLLWCSPPCLIVSAIVDCMLFDSIDDDDESDNLKDDKVWINWTTRSAPATCPIDLCIDFLFRAHREFPSQMNAIWRGRLSIDRGNVSGWVLGVSMMLLLLSIVSLCDDERGRDSSSAITFSVWLTIMWTSDSAEWDIIRRSLLLHLVDCNGDDNVGLLS